ncbi:MAG: SMP-30/gluconolactonase/LRE family protein [Anaerolineae bacterium]|jgi:sugar lactone lactonase YvrE/membrane protease YdiL (CAAX protease family)|nr:SMP-30/gluconolactonase/LRE family protein [Anaerolineae bacterium]
MKVQNIFWNASERRLRAGWRLALYWITRTIIVVILGIVLGIAAALVAFAQGEMFSPDMMMNSPIMLLGSALISVFAIIPTVWAFGRWIDWRKFSDFGFQMNLDWWVDLIFGLALGAVLMGLIFWIEKQIGWLEVIPAAEPYRWDNFYRWILRAVFLFICVGFYEELLFRGYLLKNLSEGLHAKLSARTSVAVSLIVTSVIFGIAHAMNPNATFVSSFNIALAGIFLGLGMLLNGKLAIPIGLHITWNFFQGNVFGFPVSGTNAGLSFIEIQQLGPDRWTGGNFGPEAGYIGLIAMLVGSVLTVAYLLVRYGKIGIAEEIAIYIPRKRKGKHSMKNYQADLLLDVKAALGEGPAWDERTRKLLWVNILKAEVHIFDPKTKEDRVIDLSDQFNDIGTIAPTTDPNKVLIAPDLHIALLDLTTEAVEILASVEGEKERFNDGKCGPAGNFIVGTMHASDPLGKLYNFTKEGGVQFVCDGVKTSNGLGWSPDYKTMYYVDSKYKEVYAFDYDLETGALSNKRVAFKLPAGDYSPDGLTTDKDGMIWLAWWRGYCVTRWNPATGEMIGKVNVSAPQVTACCFGGDEGKTLFITSARDGLDDEILANYPHAGSLFVLETDVEGQPTWQFKLD